METSTSTHEGIGGVQGQSQQRKPTVVITIGMAGSGKTTFVSRLNSHLHQHFHQREASSSSPTTNTMTPAYLVNLDPAVTHLPYEPNIDMRDTVSYKGVMKQYNLGPNGGIMTALNLFTTKFDQVLGLLDKRSDEIENIVIDTPGQIEIFTWSASGAIITDALASTYPTVLAYIVDVGRCERPGTWMGNMLYGCSILYKTRLPFILVFNKIDVEGGREMLAQCKEWMSDFEAFQASLATSPSTRDEAGEPTYMSSLMHSMALVLDEFYKGLRAVGVSSVTGEGFDEFMEAVEQAKEEYYRDYVPETERIVKGKEAKLEEMKKEHMERAMSDIRLDERGGGGGGWEEGDGGDDEGEEGDFDLENEEPGNMMDIRRARRGDDPLDELRWPRPG